MKNFVYQLFESTKFLFICFILLPIISGAQYKPKPINFSGQNIAFGELTKRNTLGMDTMIGVNSQIPQEIFRNDLKMTLSIYDVPISTRLFYTTEQNDFSQSINNASIFLDTKILKKNRDRAEAIHKSNKSEDPKALKALRFLSNFSRLEIGKYRPVYDELSLNGISVSGVNIEFNSKWLYAAYSSGRVKRASYDTASNTYSYLQKLNFGKVGIGRKEKSHLHFTYMHIEDDANSLNDFEISDSIPIKPQSNFLIGSDARIYIPVKKVKIIVDGRFMISLLTRDTQFPVNWTDMDNIPDNLNNYLNPNLSSSYDIAYGVKAKISSNKTTILASYDMVGSGYKTLGNPNLINDRQTLYGKLEQSIWEKHILLSAFIKYFRDNLLNWKIAQTSTYSYGLSARFVFNKVPYFQINYTPNHQITANDTISLNNRTDIIFASSGYNYKIKGLRYFTSLSYMLQNVNYKQSSITIFNTKHIITLNQAITLKFPLSLNGRLSYTSVKSSALKWDMISLVINGTYIAFKNKWRNTVGVSYRNASGSKKQDLINLYWQSKVKLWNGGDLELRLEENIFNNNNVVDETTVSSYNPSYNELVASLRFSVKW